MRKLLLATLLLAVAGCQSKTATGPGVVKITETTTTTSTVPVTTTTVPIPTEAKFTFSPVTPEVLQVVNFNGSTSVGGTDADGPHTVVSYTWDFGDGTPGSGQKPTHVFATVNTFIVRLTILDSSGKTATVTHNVAVKAP